MPEKRLSTFVLTAEALAVGAFCVISARSDYFVRMPQSVRGGASLPFMIGTRAVLLAGIFWAVNVMVLGWVGRIRHLQISRSVKVAVSIVAGIAVLVITCVLMVGLLMLTMPQY